MEDKEQQQNPDFLIQISGTSGGSVTPQTAATDFIKGSKDHFQEIVKIIEVAGESISTKIQDLQSKPNDLTIEFGINVGGEAGIPFVTKGIASANFKVTITWKGF